MTIHISRIFTTVIIIESFKSGLLANQTTTNSYLA